MNKTKGSESPRMCKHSRNIACLEAANLCVTVVLSCFLFNIFMRWASLSLLCTETILINV